MVPTVVDGNGAFAAVPFAILTTHPASPARIRRRVDRPPAVGPWRALGSAGAVRQLCAVAYATDSLEPT
jgi:hypothetical protein